MDHPYDPFKYPPDLEMARLHSKCSEPGDYRPDGKTCPCCDIQEKALVTNWAKRTISDDFIENGAVVSYFSLLKFYCAALFSVIVTYSIYQIYCINYACSKIYPDQLQTSSFGLTIKEQNHCVKAFGVWIISNMDLTNLMRIEDQSKLAILFILRSVTFLLLVIGNMVSLVVASHNKTLIIDLSLYSLFFKNINPEWKEEELKKAILELNPNIEIKDILFFKNTSSYKRWYDTKINSYFALQDDTLPLKKQNKQEVLLRKSMSHLHQLQHTLHITTPRAIVVFNHMSDRDTVFRKYSISAWEEIARKAHFAKPEMYVTPAPIMEDIMWENIGEESRQKTKMNVITFLLLLVILGISYVLLRWGLILADKSDRKNIPPAQKFWSTFVALVIVALALVFRSFMNKLADMRKPNTKTSRTLFIVSTTVVYHFIYFLIIPTIYFRTADEEERSLKLFSISYQALNFMIVQFLIVAFDLFYCCWDKNRTKILGKGAAGMCQKQVHQALTSPRFAIEFKLIVMFKTWSFATFYGFQVPYILVLLFLVLAFIYVMDKRHVYIHYRVELIESKVEYNFLKIYSNFFTVYMCLVFILTQNLTYEVYISISITIVAIVFQLLYSPSKAKVTVENTLTLEEFSPKKTYRSNYEIYLGSLRNPGIDREIDLYVGESQQGVNASADDLRQKLVK